jgi:hypothetical protein
MRGFANWKIAAAVLSIAAGSVSAQTLKADIPYTFRAGTSTLPAGSYSITVRNDGVVSLRNHEARRSALVVSAGAEDPKKDWMKTGEPRMALQCADGVCSLATLWAADGNPALLFNVLKSKGDAHIALVPLKVVGR